ncbi:MAG: helix-turn-helix domain-containing protein [Peptostreptococcaceae bacterium]
MSAIKKRLKSLREEKGLSQEELSKILNVSRSSIATYETSETVPGIDVLILYADFFETTTDYILLRTDNRNFTFNDKNDFTEIDTKFINEFADLLKRYKKNSNRKKSTAKK